MLHGADSSIGTQRTNARASLSGDPVASNLATLPVSLVDIDTKVPKPIKGSSSNLESGPSIHSVTTALQPSPTVSLPESSLLDAPPGFGSGSHVQPLNIAEDSLVKKAAAIKSKPAVPDVRNNQGSGVLKQPVNIPSSAALGI